MRKAIGGLLVLAALALLAYAFFKPKAPLVNLRVKCPEAWAANLQVAAQQYERDYGAQIQIEDPLSIEPADLVLGLADSLQHPKKNGDIKETITFAKEGEKDVQAAVPSDCQQPSDALKFARYLAAPETGASAFAGSQLRHVPGDSWKEKPELILYSGGVNRPAVEELLENFAEREGIDLTSVFNGCGVLCSAMQTMTDSENPRFPDAYYACDLCFIPPVAEHFSEVVLLTETDIGIAVPIDNPHGIKTLADLAKPGLKVGLCNQKQSTLGYMTAGILKSSSLDTAIRKNMAVEVPTADFLITQLRSDALDAAIVYRVNAELQKEEIHFIKIDHEGARAVQPFSVRSDSEKRQLANRLQDHFLAHPEAFTETGFIWRGDQGAVKSSEIEIPEWLRVAPRASEKKTK
jgi:ABC-type molybdate transport system substrate-binding protein